MNPSAPSVPGGELGVFLLQFIAIINEILVPLLFALAFFVFIWGIYLYFIQGGANEEQRDKGKQLVIWGFIGFFVMISVWGIINLLLSSFSLNSGARPVLPTFGEPASQNTQNNNAAFPDADTITGAEGTDNVSGAGGAMLDDLSDQPVTDENSPEPIGPDGLPGIH